MTELPTYNSMPPLTPRKYKTDDLRDIITEIMYTHVSSMGQVSGIEAAADAIVYEAITPYLQATVKVSPDHNRPTRTISQMSDRHERQLLTDKAERVVNQVLAFFLTVLAVVFVGGLMYKTFVWGY
jgi:hypothetical protein